MSGLGYSWGWLATEAERIARERSVPPLASAFARRHRWGQGTAPGRPVCAYCQMVPF